MSAGYSKRPLPAKLDIAPENHLLIVGAPPNYAELLVPLPEKVTIRQVSAQEVNWLDLPLASLHFIHLFTKELAELATLFPMLKTWIRANGMIWVSWPKRAAKVPTDLDENVVRTIGLDAGLVDVKVAAIDSIWSGLKFVYRLANR